MAAKKKRSSRAVGIGSMTDKDWRAEGDLDTLLQACKIRKDPARFKAAQEVAKQRIQDAAEISAQKPEHDGDE